MSPDRRPNPFSFTIRLSADRHRKLQDNAYPYSVYYYCLPFGTTVGADNTYEMTIKDGKPVFLPTSDDYKNGIKAMHEAYGLTLSTQMTLLSRTTMDHLTRQLKRPMMVMKS